MPNVETFTLTPRRFAAQAAFLGELPPVHATIAPDFLLGHLIVRLHTTVYGREVVDQTVRYPADWWQAVKARWFPRWARARWPVRETVVTFTAWHLYPTLVVPGGGSTTVYLDRQEWTRTEGADA